MLGAGTDTGMLQLITPNTCLECTNCDQPRDRFPVWHTGTPMLGNSGPPVPGTWTRSTHPHVVAPSPPQYIVHKLSLLHCMPHALGCDLQEDCRWLL